MARKKKLQIEEHPGKPRGTEHLEVLNQALPGARLDAEGNEIMSTEPIVLHLKRRTVTDLETLRNTIRAIRAHDGPIEFETFQEADDFDIEDDYGDFSSRWELPADTEGDPNMPTAEEYVRYRTTGEIPQRFLQDPSRSNSAPQAGSSSPPPVQGGGAPPAPSEPPAPLTSG